MAVRSAHALPDVVAAVAEVLDAPVSGATVVSDGLQALVATVEHPVTAETYAEILGMPATCRVLWSVENKTGEEVFTQGRRRLAVAAAQLAVRLDAEACLTFELEKVVMRRRGGVLTLHSWFPEWSEATVQAALPQPFELTDDAGRL